MGCKRHGCKLSFSKMSFPNAAPCNDFKIAERYSVNIINLPVNRFLFLRNTIYFNPITIRILKENLFNAVCTNIYFMI